MTAPANLRGWGQGWPIDRSRDMRKVTSRRSGTSFLVHHEIAPIVQFLVDETERRGYLLHRPGQTRDDWGYANRPIRGRNKPSNHSWGLAVDIDATQFPLGSSKRLPQWIVDLWGFYGFEYGGDWKGRKDPMHFEYRLAPSNARFTVAALAAHHLDASEPARPATVPPPPPPPEDTDVTMYIRLQAPGNKAHGRIEAVGDFHRRHIASADELATLKFLGAVVRDVDAKGFNNLTANKIVVDAKGVRA